MLLLIISATYAYFSVTITGNGNKMMITANTPKKHSLSVSTLYDDIHIHVDNNDMKLVNAGSYYGAVNDKRYETDLSSGTHQIIEVSSKGMENIRYSCSGDIKVTLETKDGSMGSVLEKEDVLLYLKGLGLDKTLDLSTLKINNTKIYKTTFDIDGNDSDYLGVVVELINKESYQNYIANKILNVKIEAENMVCHENGTYKYLVKLNKNLSDKQNSKETVKTVSIFYDEEGIYQKIQNIYLVDYIDTSKAIKTWELGDTERGTKLDEVMGWLEATPNENDRYDLYIGSNGPMRASQNMSYAFYNFTNLKKITGDALDTSETTTMMALFYQDTNLIDISALRSWDVSNVQNMAGLIENTLIDDLTPIKDWNVSRVITMYEMFDNCKNLTDLTPLKNWNVSNVDDMRDMFANTKINDLTPLKNWETSKVKNMTRLFYNCPNLLNISGLENWDLSNVTDMFQIFEYTPIIDITPLKNWNVSNVKTMSRLFESTLIDDITPLKDWQTSKVTTMASLFYNCKNLEDISGLINWNTESVTNISSMFYGTKISNITSLKEWNISNVVDISYLFDECHNLNDLSPISNWNVANITNMIAMFRNTKISDLSPLSNWNVSKVTTMLELFRNCTNLKNLNGLEKWNTESVTKMGGMFLDCTNLENIDAINNWNISNVNNLGGDYWYGSGMFQNCRNLTKVDLSNWNAPKLTDISRMFAGDTKLTEIKLPKGLYNNISDIKYYSGLFGGEYTASNGSKGKVSSVSPNITVYTESSQVDWIKARLQEALGENNHSTVLPYE